MKIIHFIGSIDKSAGGTATYLQMLSAELIKYARVIVVTSKTSNQLLLKGVKIYFLDFRLSKWWLLKNEFSKILRDENPDLVHINGIWDPQNWLFQKACMEQGIKVLLSPHGMLEPYILNRNFLKKQIALFLYQKNAIQSADYLHATASAELCQIRKLGFTAPAQIIPNGIDVSEVIPRLRSTSHKKIKNILFLSRIHPKKGLELLIEAISQMKNFKGNITIAGEGEDKYINQLINLCIQKDVKKYFSFIGGAYGKQKWDLFAQADLFVLPSYSENFGIVVIEALAAGVPVVTTQGTPWEELVEKKCGWWINLSTSSLRETIETALKLSINDQEEMRKNGVRLVQEKYEIQAVARQTFDFYQNIQKAAVVPLEI